MSDVPIEAYAWGAWPKQKRSQRVLHLIDEHGRTLCGSYPRECHIPRVTKRDWIFNGQVTPTLHTSHLPKCQLCRLEQKKEDS